MTDLERGLVSLATEVLQVPVDLDRAREATPEWDSLSHVRLLLAIEEEFKVRFSAEEFSAVRSLRDIAAMLGRRP